jgi:sugar fermentation stimulation protein A
MARTVPSRPSRSNPEGPIVPRVAWPPLVTGTLVKRYKRFLADVRLDDGRLITAHTPNTGSMLDCSAPLSKVFLSRSDSPTRRYPFTWEMIEMPDSLVGVNTSVPNKLFWEAARLGALPGVPPPALLEREVRAGRSRLDLKITAEDGTEVWAEAKNCTLVREGLALFPDAVSARGARHMEELSALVGPGRRALLLVLVQSAGARAFSPADSIDPAWGRALRAALSSGVEIMVREAHLSPLEVSLGPELEVLL